MQWKYSNQAANRSHNQLFLCQVCCMDTVYLMSKGDMVNIVAENKVFTVPNEVASVAGCWRRLLQSSLAFKETKTMEFTVADFGAAAIETVLRFCFEEVNQNPRIVRALIEQQQQDMVHTTTTQHIPGDGIEVNTHGYAVPIKVQSRALCGLIHHQERVVFQFTLEPELVMEVLMAAHFLDVPPLVDLASYMLTHHIEGTCYPRGT